MRLPFIASAVLLTVIGCAGGERVESDTAVPATPSTSGPEGREGRARAAASVANAIAANPAGADSILKAAGYTRDTFQTMMYEIAADSAMSVAYAVAKGR